MTAIADSWGDTTNNCQNFEYGDWQLTQKSAACDRIIGGLARYEVEYQQIKDSLKNGPMSEFVVNTLIDQWQAQITNATLDAHQMHDDALNPSTWQNAIIELKSQLEHARNN